MRKKIIALIVLPLAALCLVAGWLLSDTQLERVANHFLGPDFSLQIAQKTDFGLRGATVPSLALQLNRGAPCWLVNLHNLYLDWWGDRSLKAEKAVIDYACLADLSADSGDEKTPLNLTVLLSVIPDGELEVRSVEFINTQQVLSPTLRQLLQGRTHIRLNKRNERLELSGEVQQESAVIFRLNLALDKLLLAGSADYAPSEKQPHRLDFQLNLNDDLTRLPEQGRLVLHWKRDDLTVPDGRISLQWKQRQGRAELQDLSRQTPLLDLPFTFGPDRIEIEKGNFSWEIGEEQPLQGVLNLKLEKTTQDWLPLKTDVRVSLLSEGKQGKGNLVIYGSNGVIGRERIEIPLEAHGNFKYDASVAYVDTVFNLAGFHDDPFVHFKPASTARVTGRGQNLTLNVTLPLDGVIIGRYGIEGRLRAILQGETPQFSGLDLRLDGNAHEFIAGIKSIFDIRDTHNRLRRAEGKIANHWQWNLTGKGVSKALKTPVEISGKGFWLNNHVEIQELEGHSGAIHTAGIRIPKVELKLTDNLRWYYEEEKIRGLVQARAPFIELDYGGRFVEPVFGLGLDGKDITDFNLAGDLKAGSLGPIKVFAHYREQALVGNIYWLEQSAKVFQSLFPKKWNWIIQKGTIRGQTAFDITAEKGIQAGGHFAIRAGEISLPDGEIKGIEFALPYRYLNNAVELVKNPVKVFIRQVTSGVLQIENVSVKVQGYYPYSRRRQLSLSELNFDLLGGRLSVNRLALPQQKIAEVKLTDIDVAQVLAMAQYNQVAMTGRVNATFPFWLEGKECMICNGEIGKAQNENIRVKLSDELVRGLKRGGWTESILVDVISEMDLQEMNTRVNMSPDGMMRLTSTIKGYNPQKETRNPITLNYNHQENLYELWELIDYGSQFEQKLEHKIYRNLEKE